LALVGCGNSQPARVDHARLTSKVVMRDEVFQSAALGRQMHYRVILPTVIASGQQLSVVYLLHGADGDFRDWSNNSGVAQYAEGGLLFVMPQGDYSYYVNAAERAKDRYEDYIVQDLVADVEAKFPAARGRANRAIVGVSMGGFGALKIALSHPDLFVFSGALSPSVDAPRRAFSVRRIQQSVEFRYLFGFTESARRRNDPFLIARDMAAPHAPYLFLSCGESESLLPTNREFAALIERRRLPFEFHVAPGGHDWNQWDQRLPSLFAALRQHVGRERQIEGKRQ
jgi:S-formylglutathione hydrolase FrmB